MISLALQRIANTELQNPFDRRALPAYAITGTVAICGLIFLAATGFIIAREVWLGFFSWPIISIFGGLGLRRLGHPNFGGAMEAMGLVYGQGLFAFLLLVPLAAFSAPFADPWLSHIDSLIGFDWVAFARLTSSVSGILSLAYKSLVWQPVLVVFWLFFTKRSDRGWAFVIAGTIALVITTLLFPLAPARGPMLHYGFHVWSPAPPFAAALEALKGGYRSLDRTLFVGLVSFPSYHAASAVIFTWAAWPTRLRLPLIFVNAILLVSALPLGNHYLIDIIAGAAVGSGSVLLALRFAASNGPSCLPVS